MLCNTIRGAMCCSLLNTSKDVPVPLQHLQSRTRSERMLFADLQDCAG